MEDGLKVDDICFHNPSKRPGKLRISRKSIDLTLFDFRAGESHAEWMPKSVQLQSAEYATLFDVRMGCLTRSHSTEVISSNQFFARQAIIGGREWTESDRVAVIEFMLSDTSALFAYGEHLKRSYKPLSRSRDRTVVTYDFSREEIIKIYYGSIKLTIGLVPKIHTQRRDFAEYRDKFISIEFPESVDLQTAFHHLFHVEIFFMLAIGWPCFRYGVAISTEGDEGARNESNCFTVYQAHNDELPQPKGDSEPLFTCSTAIDRRRLRKALLAWMDRRNEWNLTYWMIHTFIRDCKLYDRNRLIRVMAWFESLPDFQGHASFSNRKLSVLKEAVSNLLEFKELGISKERLAILGELRRPLLVDRIERAFRSMRSKYSKDIFSSELLDFCKLAKKYRDEAAHGGAGDSVDEFHKLIMASTAIETLTFACTLADLGVSAARMRRITHPVIAHPFARFNELAASPIGREAEEGVTQKK